MVEFETPSDRLSKVKAEDMHPEAKKRARMIAKGDFRDPKDAMLDDDEARKDLQARVIGRAG